MVNRMAKLSGPLPASYDLKIRRAGVNGAMIEKTLSSSEIDKLTPNGKAITTSREEILSVLRRSGRNIKRQPSAAPEAAGAAKVPAIK
ncbi:hypothetical protein [Erwinia sp. 9145]|uniref:hypothetical protein n=1 Tax=Erwinia sp. 9145 TaxID=1500895 RepID=UPI00069006D0|nr:hypothetical protein [Erwinia sp. 9145]